MPFRKVAIRSTSSFLGFALAGVLAAGLAASPAHAATTTYDTNNTPYTGGTIDPGDTVLLNDGAAVTHHVGHHCHQAEVHFGKVDVGVANMALDGAGRFADFSDSQNTVPYFLPRPNRLAPSMYSAMRSFMNASI
jgi:hypothetical protein